MNTHENIALSMIVKGDEKEAPLIDRALESIAPYVDKIFITITGEEAPETKKVLSKYNVRVSRGTFTTKADKKMVDWLEKFFGWKPHLEVGDEIFLFNEARNYNMSQIPQDKYPWILWLDSDDIFHGGEKLQKVIQSGKAANVEAWYFEYLYQVELDENKAIAAVVIKHLRERLIRNIGVYKWIAPIHETLIEQRPTVKTDSYDCAVIHLAEMEDRMESLKRNLKVLEYAIYLSEGKDPRQIYYLAKAYYDLNTEEYDNKMIPLTLNHYILGEHRSGWPEERSQAFEYLSDVFKRRGMYDKAIMACMNAMIEDPQNPSIYLNVAAAYMYKRDWERGLFWVRVASSIPEKKTTLVQNPQSIQSQTLQIIYHCSINLSKVDEAWAAAVKLVELFPEDTLFAQQYQFVESLKQQRDITKNIVELANYLKAVGERPKIKALLAAAPQIVQDNPFLVNLYQQNVPPTAWGEKEIAIYCGPGFTNWSPKRLDDPKEAFVGGSEEAVILMSKQLQKIGWNVTVYADPGVDEGEYDGVKWLPYYKFNRQDNFNILIGWRDVRFFDTEFKAEKTYLWCHDILNPLEFTPERTQRITKIIVLSKFHRDCIDHVQDDKILISSNGI